MKPKHTASCLLIVNGQFSVNSYAFTNRSDALQEFYHLQKTLTWKGPMMIICLTTGRVLHDNGVRYD